MSINGMIEEQQTIFNASVTASRNSGGIWEGSQAYSSRADTQLSPKMTIQSLVADSLPFSDTEGILKGRQANSWSADTQLSTTMTIQSLVADSYPFSDTELACPQKLRRRSSAISGAAAVRFAATPGRKPQPSFASMADPVPMIIEPSESPTIDTQMHPSKQHEEVPKVRLSGHILRILTPPGGRLAKALQAMGAFRHVESPDVKVESLEFPVPPSSSFLEVPRNPDHLPGKENIPPEHHNQHHVHGEKSLDPEGPRCDCSPPKTPRSFKRARTYPSCARLCYDYRDSDSDESTGSWEEPTKMFHQCAEFAGGQAPRYEPLRERDLKAPPPFLTLSQSTGSVSYICSQMQVNTTEYGRITAKYRHNLTRFEFQPARGRVFARPEDEPLYLDSPDSIEEEQRVVRHHLWKQQAYLDVASNKLLKQASSLASTFTVRIEDLEASNRLLNIRSVRTTGFACIGDTREHGWAEAHVRSLRETVTKNTLAIERLKELIGVLESDINKYQGTIENAGRVLNFGRV